MVKLLRTIKSTALLGVSGALFYAAATQWAGEWWPVELLSHFRVFVLGACVLGTLFFVATLSLSRVLIGVGVSVWLLWPMHPYLLPISSEAEGTVSEGAGAASRATGQEVSIALYNVYIGNDSPDLMDRILSWDDDVVALLEVSPEFYRDHYQAVRERYPHHYARPEGHAFGMWVFSRLPVEKDLSLTRTKAFDGITACDWQLKLADGSRFRLVVAHPPPPSGRVACAERLHILRALADPFAGRADQAGVLVGDLNCTPFSAYFRSLIARSGMRDSALGRGMRPTWGTSRAPYLGLMLDHVLVTPHWEVVDYRLGAYGGSDHRPVRVRLRRVTGGAGK